MRKISILGSTGSIGESALDVVRFSKGELSVAALCAGSNVARLIEQARELRPDLVAVADGGLADELRRGLEGLPVRVAAGVDGVIEAATHPDAEIVLAAVVGAAGIVPAWHALEAGKDLALANKETLVAAGEVIMETARRRGRKILPVDSEHSALFQTLEGRRRDEVATVTLTASGGPFWADPSRDLGAVTPADALRHPKWSMGDKVSIDSATLMNKGLEVIEAQWLFDMELERIKVLVHPQSIVHSIVEFIDGSMLAHLSRPDMRLPIAAALHHPKKCSLPWERLDLAAVGSLEFHEPDDRRFPALGLARRAQNEGGTAPAILNAANEIAVEAFLAGRIPFTEIVNVTGRVLASALRGSGPLTVESVLAADGAAREKALSLVEEISLQWRGVTS